MVLVGKFYFLSFFFHSFWSAPRPPFCFFFFFFFFLPSFSPFSSCFFANPPRFFLLIDLLISAIDIQVYSLVKKINEVIIFVFCLNAVNIIDFGQNEHFVGAAIIYKKKQMKIVLHGLGLLYLCS